MNIIIKHDQLFLSPDYITSHSGTKPDTLKTWKKRRIGHWVQDHGISYVSYESIPLPTQSRLPGKETILKEVEDCQTQETIYKILERAKWFQSAQYASLYNTECSLSAEKVTLFSQRHAVIHAILNMRSEGIRDLSNLFAAYNRIFPNQYSSTSALSRAIKLAKINGIESVAIDKRAFGNNVEANSKKITAVHRYWISFLTGHGSKYSCTEMHKKLCAVCESRNYTKPSLSWVKKQRYIKLTNVEIFKARYGQQELQKTLPYASLQTPDHANDQWQMDGWIMPFWGQRFKRYVLVRIIDTKSSMIVGFAFGDNEDSTVIMEAIKDAVNNTGVLPFEVLTDNHAFNQTQEAKNLLSLFAKRGARWTVTQNPQYKAKIERYNQYLDSFCKEYYGYLGQGIKSKSIDALAKPELIAQYAKYFLSRENIHCFAIDVVAEHNKKVMNSGVSPSDAYDASQNPHPITANVYDRATLLTLQADKKITRGQITIKKGIVKHEFQLPADLFQRYNDTTVIVRYEDLRDGIYLFDKKTGEGICSLEPKQKIQIAKHNQTQDDIDALHRHSGRIKGIKSKAVKELEELTKKAHDCDPEAHLLIDTICHDKSAKMIMEQDANLKQKAEERGVNIKLLEEPAGKRTNDSSALKPKLKDVKSPFATGDNEIKKVDPNDFFKE